MIYLDYAATSWPKPPEVLRAMTSFLECAGGNPGRSGHGLSVEAARIVYDAREETAGLFNAPDPLRVVFTLNATHAINLALQGILRPGDGVVASSIEHNAVMRPLRALEKQGVQVSIAQCNDDGTLDPAAVTEAIRPNTRMIVIVHGSNVTGTLLPVAEIASVVHRAGALLLVDAAQTAGAIPIDIQAMGIDFLAFTGHKALYGPTGVGGLVINSSVDVSRLEPVLRGGTGSQSESEEQPEYLPDKYECGTPNAVGIAGLGAGIRWVKARGIEQIRYHEMRLVKAILSGLNSMPGVKVYGTQDVDRSVPVVSFTISGQYVSDIGSKLDEDFGVLCRVGLHCAPAAHRTIGTFPDGTVRFAPGLSTTLGDVNAAVMAVQRVIRG